MVTLYMMGSGEERHMKQSTKTGSKEITRQAYIQLQKGDAQKAQEYFESAAERARDEGDMVMMITSYLNAGACLVSRDQFTQGNDCLLLSLKLAKTQKLDKNVSRTTDGKETQVTMIEISADIYYNLAVAARKMDNFKKAISHFKTSVEFYLKAGSVLHAAESFTNLAGCHRMLSETHEEVSNLVSAQHLYHELGDNHNEAESCLELARTYMREGKMEDCKEMLSTAKLLCLRVDNQELQGKLYSQFGLIYTSMGLYDLGIQNFERALPLVRGNFQTDQSLQAEASLLQNIGAAYNEKALFLEAMIYHKEAATIHGKVHNHNSESKSLCNLGYAQTQLNQLQEAAKTFSNALAKAYQAKNNFLQFQTCEGLGSINQQMGKYGDAVTCFQQALTILDQIREDTGIARERVMEKLSEASEALEKIKIKQGERENLDSESTGDEETVGKEPRSKLYLTANNREVHVKANDGARLSSLTSVTVTSGEDGPINEGYKDSMFSGFTTSPHPGVNEITSTALSPVSPHPGVSEITSIALSPIPTAQTPNHEQENGKKLSITERRGVKALPPIKAQNLSSVGTLPPLPKQNLKKGKQKLSHMDRDADEASDYSANLQAYVESYNMGSNDSLTSWSQEVEKERNEQADLAASPPTLTPHPHFLAREGSLALGVDAKDNYTVQTIQEWSQGKGGKKKHHTRSEIIRTSSSSPVLSDDSIQQKKPTSQPKTQSVLCTIL